MKRFSVLFHVLLAIYAILLGRNEALSAVQLSDSQNRYHDGQKRWSAQESVKMQNYAAIDGDEKKENEVAVPSPNGEYFFIGKWYNDLESDQIVAELIVYSAIAVVRAIEHSGDNKERCPKYLNKITRRDRRAVGIPIDTAQWTSDKTIEFRGINEEDGTWQLFEHDIITGRTNALTNAPFEHTVNGRAGVTHYARKGKGLLYVTPDHGEITEPYPMYPVRTEQVLKSGLLGIEMVEKNKVHASFDGNPEWQLTHQYLFAQDIISPDGRLAILVGKAPSVPSLWMAYNGISKKSFAGSSDKQMVPDEFEQFILIDLENERETPVIDAPTGRATKGGSSKGLQAPKVFWAEDSRHVVLVNTALPLIKTEKSSECVSMAYIITYDVNTSQWHVLQAMEKDSGEKVSNVSWRVSGKELLVEHKLNEKPASDAVYAFDGLHWVLKEMDTSPTKNVKSGPKCRSLAHGLTVIRRQECNSPPVVFAECGAKGIALFEPDSVLQSCWLARSESFHWLDGLGEMRIGSLLLPRVHPKAGVLIPLVIQIGGYTNPECFNPDGAATTAYAAQALAAQGLAVLNIDVNAMRKATNGSSPHTRAMCVDWIDTAVYAAAIKHPIDIGRVGLVGFSYAGALVRHAVTHPARVKPAAALIADSFPWSFFGSLATLASRGASGSLAFEKAYGGSFFESKSSWLEQEVSFNVDKVRTPVLFADNVSLRRTIEAIQAIETIGSFKAAGRPFEFLIFPGGGHNLTAPRQREASMQATVDWMAFWLLERIPADSERAAHWADLRKQQDEVLKTPPSPKGKWVFQPDPVQPEWHPPAETKKGYEPAR